LCCSFYGVSLSQLDLRERDPCKVLFTCLRLPTACHDTDCAGANAAHSPVGLNSIALNPVRPHIFALGGSDELARVYDLRRSAGALPPPVDFPYLSFRTPSLTNLRFSPSAFLKVARVGTFLLSCCQGSLPP